jgi:outer membrane receptor for ferrienterochelin and colicins
MMARCFYALAIALAAPVTAHADDASEAQLQFELGTAYYEQGRYPEANERFLASYRLVENARVGANIVRTYEVQGRLADAYNWCETVERRFPDSAEVLDYVRGKRAELEPRLMVLAISTDPEGAELFVIRENLGSLGRSPRRIAIDPERARQAIGPSWNGSIAVIATLDGHRSAEASVAVEVGRVTPVELSLTPLVGIVRITSTPAGATVRDRRSGDVLGTTPLEIERSVGELPLVLALDRHASVERTLIVREGEPTLLEVELERRFDQVAILTVRGTPRAARVRIGDRVVGAATPLTLDELPPGTVDLTLESEGRLPWSTAITLEAGSATRVDYTLADPSDAHSAVWLWIGYGLGGAALAAGGVVGAVALGERDAFFERPSSAQLDRVDALNVAADALAISGAVVLGATFVYHLLRPGEPRSGGRVTIDR